MAYDMAMPCSRELSVATGKRRADALVRLVPKAAWQRRFFLHIVKSPDLWVTATTISRWSTKPGTPLRWVMLTRELRDLIGGMVHRQR
jgi:hypothetical protein